MEAVAFVPIALFNAWGALVLLATVMVAPLASDAVGASLGASPWFVLLYGLASLLAGVMADGALYRLGVGGVRGAGALGLGVGGIQFGRPELRLMAANALIGLFLLMVIVAAGVVLAFVLNAVGLEDVEWTSVGDLFALQGVDPPWKAQLVSAFALGAALVIVFLVVQMSLFEAATIARKRIVSLDALALAEGNFLRLAAGLIVCALPSLALAWVQFKSLGSLDSAAETMMRGETASRALMQFAAVQALVSAFVQKPLTVGFLSAAYRRLEYWSPDEGGGE